MICPKCGFETRETVNFCPCCGAELSSGFHAVADSSPFHPAADIESQPSPTPQSKESRFSAPDNLGDSKASFDAQPSPCQWSEPNTVSEASASSGGTSCNKDADRNLQPEDSSAPAKKKSLKKRILAVSAVCVAAAACVAAALIFVFPKKQSAPENSASGNNATEINGEITSLVESYSDEDGFVALEDCAKVAETVCDYAKELEHEKKIQEYAFNEDSSSVTFLLNDGTMYIYCPPIRDMLDDGDEFSVMSITTYDDFAATVYGILDKLVHGTIGGPYQSAKYIYDHCAQCTQLDNITNNHSDAEDLKEKFMAMDQSNTRAIFFHGHGTAIRLTDGESLWSVFAVGGNVTEENNEKYRTIFEPDEVVVRSSISSPSGMCYAITPKFIEHYMANVNGGLFFSSACCSAADGGSMANAFIEKGFDCYVGTSDTVTTTYGMSFMKYTAMYLTENDNGEFTDIHTALEKAKEQCGETDANGTEFVCIDKDSETPFRLSGGKMPTEQEVLDAYVEACNFYGSWFYSGYANSGWVKESQKYVETYEDGNMSVNDFYYERHCRVHDTEITTVAQLKDSLYNYFLPDFADALLKNADPIESDGKLYTYAPGPFVPMCAGVEKLESIEKTDEHTWLLTVSGHTQWDENEIIYGRVLCEYKDGSCLFSIYDEENSDYLIGDSVFDLIGELSLPSNETEETGSSTETAEPSTTQPESLENGGLVSAEVIPGDENDGILNAAGQTVMSLCIDTLSVKIPGNDAAAQKIMEVFLSLKESIRSKWESQYADATDYVVGLGMSDTLSLTVCRADPSTISVFALETTYLGGNMATHGIKGYTFSTQSGDALTLSDLTADAAGLKKLLHDACWEQLQNDQDYPVPNQAGFDGLFDSDEFEWTLDKTGIHIYFPEYSIGAHSAGIIQCVIPYSDVTGYVYDWVIPE